VLATGDATQRRAAVLALSASPDARAKELLDAAADLAAAVARGDLSWDNLNQAA
jgi:hypothetical protein